MNSNETKNILLTALSGVLYYFLSFLGHKIAFINTVIFLIICAAVLFLSIKRFEIAVGLAFLELILSSFGRMFFLDIYGAQITLRMALFLIIVGVWTVRQLKAKRYPVPEQLRYRAGKLQAKIYYPLLFVAAIWGIIRGFISNNSFNNVFADANAFLFFGYLGPAMEAVKTAGWGRVKHILAGGIVTLWIMTMFSAIGFGNGLFEVGGMFYKWIRDSRLGEVTFVNDQFSRVFFQAHVFALFGFFIFAVMVINKKFVYLVLASICASIFWLNLSRSYWVGIAVGLAVLTILFLVSKRRIPHSREYVLVPFLALVTGFALGTILIPTLPQTVFSRGINVGDPASSSRKAMLSPLFKEIIKNPVLGSGFGIKITYKTRDPRALERNPSGEITTFAFEWGWLDLWVKTGLLGVLAYIGLILAIFRHLYRQFRLTDNGLYLGVLAGIIALAVTHTFSPYLNHPLGIGLLLLADAIAEDV